MGMSDWNTCHKLGTLIHAEFVANQWEGVERTITAYPNCGQRGYRVYAEMGNGICCPVDDFETLRSCRSHFKAAKTRQLARLESGCYPVTVAVVSLY